MAPLDDEAPLLAWYQALTPLSVDIIGDFAGKETFAIHGEALLAYCISEAKVNCQGTKFFSHRKNLAYVIFRGKKDQDLPTVLTVDQMDSSYSMLSTQSRLFLAI